MHMSWEPGPLVPTRLAGRQEHQSSPRNVTGSRGEHEDIDTGVLPDP